MWHKQVASRSIVTETCPILHLRPLIPEEITIILHDMKTHILYEGTQVDVILVMSHDLDTARTGTVILSNLLAPG